MRYSFDPTTPHQSKIRRERERRREMKKIRDRMQQTILNLRQRSSLPSYWDSIFSLFLLYFPSQIFPLPQKKSNFYATRCGRDHPPWKYSEGGGRPQTTSYGGRCYAIRCGQGMPMIFSPPPPLLFRPAVALPWVQLTKTLNFVFTFDSFPKSKV